MKPIVHYRNKVNAVVGLYTVVDPIDHPSPRVSNTCPVCTSRVVRVGENGEFETENTIYRLAGSTT